MAIMLSVEWSVSVLQGWIQINAGPQINAGTSVKRRAGVYLKLNLIDPTFI